MDHSSVKGCDKAIEMFPSLFLFERLSISLSLCFRSNSFSLTQVLSRGVLRGDRRARGVFDRGQQRDGDRALGLDQDVHGHGLRARRPRRS